MQQFSESQWCQFDRICEKWIALSRATKKPDRKNVSAALKDLYHCYGLPNPVVIWCQSPWQMDLLAVTLQTMLSCDAKWDAINGGVLDSRAESRWQSFFARLPEQMRPDRYARLLDDSPKPQTDFSPAPKVLGSQLKTQRNPARGLTAMRLALPLSRHLDTLHKELSVDLVVELVARLTRKLAFGGTEIAPDILRPRHEDIRFLSSRILKMLSPGFLSSGREASSFGGAIWTGTRSAAALDESLMRLFLERRTQESRWSIFPFPTLAPILEFVDLALPDLFAGKKLPIWWQLGQECYACLFFEHVCFACEWPTNIQFDEQNRLHNGSGAALEFADGFKVYAWHGRTVAREAIETTDLTIDKIHAENNVESRRVMIERLGVARYITESGATILHQDEYGVLYCQSIRGDEPILVLKVLNSTPEPDGTFKEYFLRVPPHIMTAREAVAWTFGMREFDYAPVRET